MRILVIMAFAIAISAGCTTSPRAPSYGNFLLGAPATDGQAMADDVAGKLAATYPPARTRFALRQDATDAFGARLVALLRKRGYEMAELGPGSGLPGPRSEPIRGSELSSQLTLAYIVDQPLEEAIYRVTVVIDSHTLSRLYRSNDGSISPAGQWIRKE